MELNEYQRLANQTDQQPETGSSEVDSRSILIPLLGLAGEVGELLGEHKKRLRDGDSYKLFPDRVKEELGDLLWYLSDVATKHNLMLEDVARYNLRKTQRRWQTVPTGAGPRRLFDESFPEEERLPRQMEISIEEGSGRVVTSIDGSILGNQLRDNRYEDDGYRYHDIFHLSYASVLGWSPTMRSLLRCKRKSDPKVDEVEDGGRAIVVEEGIAGMVFSYAERRNALEGAEGVNYDLLRTIKDMTSHLEVSCRTEGEWERAIMTGFQVWRQVRSNRGGRVRADLERMSLEFVG
ncbi:MAG: nucleoside triphosphate pyrophosphohydrolase family protein [Caldilineaceae bacterium]|nr:nucleoside triphosphate pyrophosphohydrolase family protein [Caldilineaceae bacterium]